MDKNILEEKKPLIEMILYTELICTLMWQWSWTVFKTVQTYKYTDEDQKTRLSGKHSFSYKTHHN